MKAYLKGANVLGHGHGGGGHGHGGHGGGRGGFWGGWGDYDDVDLIPYYVPVVNLVDDEDDEVLGAVLRDFDNTQTFNAGEVVRYWGKYWKATRQVTPPLFPSLQSGDVPGESDAWQETNAASVIYGETGFVDIGALSKSIRAQNPLSSDVAHSIAAGGIAACDAVVNSGILQPGATARVNGIGGELAAFMNQLLLLPDPVPEPMATGIRETAIKAFIELNAGAAGSQTLANARAQIFPDVMDTVKSIPSSIASGAKAAFNAVTEGVSSAGSTVKWVAIGLGAAAALGLGISVYSAVRGRR